MMKHVILKTVTLILGFYMLLSASPIDEKRLVRLPVKTDPTISFRIIFNAGTQYDPAGKEGLAQLTARLLSDGSTKNNPYDSILKKLFPLAASFYVSADKEIAVFAGRIHKDNLEPYYQLFTEQILQPAFKEEEFNRVKEEELSFLSTTLRYSSDEELGKAVLYNSIYSGTPYAHPDAGYIASVKSITLQDVKDFYKKYYNQGNFILGIGGGYDDNLVNKLWSDLEKLSEGIKAVPPEITPHEFSGLNCTIIEKNANATAISIGYPIDLVRGSKEWYALAVANSWLGEHRNSSSHLYQVIREARGLNYGDYSYIEHYPNGGRLQFPPVNVPRRHHIFEIWIRPVPNETAHFALRAALQEFQKLADNGLTKEQFELTRNFLRKYILHYAQTTNERLGYALDDEFYGLRKGHLAQYRDALDHMTLDDVNKAIKKYFKYNNLKIAVITKNAEEFKKSLTADAPSPIKYSTKKDDSILEDDKEISKYPLKFSPDKVKIIKLEEIFN